MLSFSRFLDRDKFPHNCNRQNIHVAETMCTPVSAIFVNLFLLFCFQVQAGQEKHASDWPIQQ